MYMYTYCGNFVLLLLGHFFWEGRGQFNYIRFHHYLNQNPLIGTILGIFTTEPLGKCQQNMAQSIF